MTEDKMRAEFEAWYIEHHKTSTGRDVTAEKMRELRGPHGDYREYSALHGKWIGWQASRKALCVELPEASSPGDFCVDVPVAELECMKLAIDKAGVAYK